MKAIVKEGPGPGFVWKQVPCPQVPSDGVIVQVKAVGICGTDIPILNGLRPVPPGLIPGHEFAGVITEVGAAVRGWSVGDRVAVGMVKGCGECHHCRSGDEPMCNRLIELGIDVNGAYTEFTASPASCLHRLPDALSFEEGAAVDPIASAYRGVRKAGVDKEDTVVIFGPGAIGLYALQLIKTRGEGTTIVIGPPEDRSRLQVAKKLGADHVLTTEDGELAKQVASATDGRMAQVVIEATGNATVLPTVLSCAAKTARVILLGIFHTQVVLDPIAIVRRELQVLGSLCYSWEDFEASLQLLGQGQVTTRNIVTHTLALEQLGDALQMLRERQAIKVILKP